jgi:hypothetical protein
MAKLCKLKQAAKICLADITLNNPNVWYEVGYRIVIMDFQRGDFRLLS